MVKRKKKIDRPKNMVGGDGGEGETEGMEGLPTTCGVCRACGSDNDSGGLGTSFNPNVKAEEDAEGNPTGQGDTDKDRHL